MKSNKRDYKMKTTTNYVTFDMIQVAMNATNPPLQWTKEALIRVGRRDNKRLPHVRPGSRESAPMWERDVIVRFIQRNHPNQPEIALQFAEALDRAISA